MLSHLFNLFYPQVCLPEWVLAVRPGINQDYQATQLRLYASSPAVSEVAINLDLDTGQVTQHQQQQHQQDVSHSGRSSNASSLHLVCERLWATAADGVQVPLTLLHRAGLPSDGPQPLLVEVYGAYGQVLEADYKAYRLPLLQRGWSVALAHVRGGGELGRRWEAHMMHMAQTSIIVLCQISCQAHIMHVHWVC